MRRREQTVFPGKIRLRPPLALIPPVGLAQAVVERPELEPELGPRALHPYRDRREVEVYAEVERRREQSTASGLDALAGDAHEARLVSSDACQRLDELDLRHRRIIAEIVGEADRHVRLSGANRR